MTRLVEVAPERYAAWRERFDAYARESPELARGLYAALERRLPEGWDAEIPTWTRDDKPIATRAASA